jgi:hypothetical protein
MKIKNSNINKNKIVINIENKKGRRTQQAVKQQTKQQTSNQPVFFPIPIPQQQQPSITPDMFKTIMADTLKSSESKMKELYEAKVPQLQQNYNPQPIARPASPDLFSPAAPFSISLPESGLLSPPSRVEMSPVSVIESVKDEMDQFNARVRKNPVNEGEMHAQKIARNHITNSIVSNSKGMNQDEREREAKEAASYGGQLPTYDNFGTPPSKGDYIGEDGKVKKGLSAKMKADLKDYAGQHYQEKVDGKLLTGGALFDFILENAQNQLPKSKGGRKKGK